MTELNLGIPCGISANILGGYFARHTSQWTETKTKSFYTLWNLTEGDVIITVDGKEHKAKKGDAVLFSPGDTYSAGSETGCEFSFVFFTLETGNSLDLLKDFNPSGVIFGEYLSDSKISFNESFMENRKRGYHGDFKLYYEFLGYITDILSAIEKGRIARFHEGDSAEDSLMRKAIDFIDASYEQSPEIGDIAKKFGFSEKYFITKFRSVLGISPKQYVVRCKMKRALELITTTDTKLREVAIVSGYSDQYALSKAFKKFYGESPSSYRKSKTTEK